MNRKLGQRGSVLALSMLAFLAAGAAAAGDRWDYWDPRASIPARIVDTHLGVIGLAATIAGDYRTAAVVDHLSGRYPAPVPVAVPVVQHVYYPPPPVVEHVYYPAPAPVVVRHVHAAGCGHGGYYGGHHGHGRRHHGHHGRGHRGHGRHGGWDD